MATCGNCTQDVWDRLTYDEKRRRLTGALCSSENVLAALDKLHTLEEERVRDGEGSREWLNKVDSFMQDMDDEHTRLEEMLDKLDEEEEKKEKGD